MLQIAQKLYVGVLSALCEMYKLFIQQLYRKNFMQVRAFERYIPLIEQSHAILVLIAYSAGLEGYMLL